MIGSHNPPLLSYLLDVRDTPDCPEDYRDTNTQERRNVCVYCVWRTDRLGRVGCDTAVLSCGICRATPKSQYTQFVFSSVQAAHCCNVMVRLRCSCLFIQYPASFHPYLNSMSPVFPQLMYTIISSIMNGYMHCSIVDSRTNRSRFHFCSHYNSYGHVSPLTQPIEVYCGHQSVLKLYKLHVVFIVLFPIRWCTADWQALMVVLSWYFIYPLMTLAQNSPWMKKKIG